MTPVPKHILIVGGGEFGLSTALAFLHRPTYSGSHITILESSSILPNPVGSSVDASRIIRADYAHKSYASLASQAQLLWRDQSPSGWGGEGRYTETGFVLTADEGREAYVSDAMANVRALANAGLPIDIKKIEQLHDRAAIREATCYDGVSGDKGYANWNSGWAHAEKVVRYALRRIEVEGKGKVTVLTGTPVTALLIKDGECRGVRLRDNEITADLTVLAAGAWTPSLLDLEGRCLATGQPLAYFNISAKEQVDHGSKPVIMNLSRGTFIIPPTDHELKIALHSFGYLNWQNVRFHDGVEKQVSVPKASATVPEDAKTALQVAMEGIIPSMTGRPIAKTRICWYTDTPDGNFLIDHHPDYRGLVVATGGSGHAFKFFPVIGDKIVDRVAGTLDKEFAELWKWKTKAKGFTCCEDGSRSGEIGIEI